MRNLDEAIILYRSSSEANRKAAQQVMECDYMEEKMKKLRADILENIATDDEQLASWLEELKEWPMRVEESKDGGRASIILKGKTVYLTDGHVKALFDYDVQKTIQDAIDNQQALFIVKDALGGSL